MKVLVTGMDGYVGTVLGPALLNQGHDVVGLDAGFFRTGWLYNGLRMCPPWITLDVRHATVGLLRGFDAVVHLAELSNDPLGELNPAVTHSINYRGSVQLAKRAKAAGVKRFVYASSCSVYGIQESEDYKTEETAPNPQTVYAQCKVRAERGISRLAGPEFAPIFLRNATIFGPSPRMRFDLVLNQMAGRAWIQRLIQVNDETLWRPLVHVEDVCEAISCALVAPQAAIHNQVFNVGSTTENYQIGDIASIVEGVFRGCRVVWRHKRGGGRSYLVSFEKIRTQLPGFQCRWTARGGAEQLRELFEWVALSSRDFERKSYTRLKLLQWLLQTGQLSDELFWTNDRFAPEFIQKGRGS